MFVHGHPLLIVSSQVFNIPRVLQLSSIQGFQVVGSLPLVVDDPVRSFPIQSQLPMGRVFGGQRNPFKDEIPNVEAPRFHHGIILLCHKIFVPHYSLLCVHPHLIYKIEVQMKLFFVFFILILHHPVIGHVHFCRYNCLTSVGQLKKSFPYGDPHCCFVSPQNTQ